MKISKALYPTLLVLLILLACSCQSPKELVYRDFKNLKLGKLGFGASTLNLQLKSTDLDIFVDNTYLGHSSQDLQVNIPRLAEFTLPLQVELDMKNALKNVLPTLFGKEVVVKMTGKVKLGKANVYKSFTVNYESIQKFSAF